MFEVKGEKFLDVYEMMKWLKLSRESIYAYVRQGMPSLKLGWSRFFNLKDVKKWLKKNKGFIFYE